MIRIGPAGWSYKDWEGIVYPPNPPKGFHGAAYLAQFFDTIEVNSSFYRSPLPSAVRGWVLRVSANPKFKYTVKLYRGFTHERNASQEDERAVKDAFNVFLGASRLGAVLMQFPISFKFTPENRQYIAGLRQRLREYPLVLEVRHSSWNDARALEMLAELGIGFCNIDQPRLGRSLRPTEKATSPVGYVRLHGRNFQNWFAENRTVNERYDYLYSPTELEPWVERTRKIADEAEDTYVVTNNHNLGKAVVNAFELSAFLSGRPVRPSRTTNGAVSSAEGGDARGPWPDRPRDCSLEFLSRFRRARNHAAGARALLPGAQHRTPGRLEFAGKASCRTTEVRRAEPRRGSPKNSDGRRQVVLS